MIPDKATRDEWRRLFHCATTMHSAIDEYAPEEFLTLLNAVDELEAQRDALLAAAKQFLRSACRPGDDGRYDDARKTLWAAIAKAEGTTNG